MKLWEYLNGKKTLLGTGFMCLFGIVTVINTYFPLPESVITLLTNLKPMFEGLGLLGAAHLGQKLLKK